MLKLENPLRGLSFSRVAFDLTIQGIKKIYLGGMAFAVPPKYIIEPHLRTASCQ